MALSSAEACVRGVTVYGGHSHVGTMLYLGDNWPREYRNHLFTQNLHGHQINLRERGGYNMVHAGTDVFFCGDRQFIGVDLQYGPDGAVYVSDWYDPRHCHNPDVEEWDRGNGRLHRLKYDATFQPRSVDYHSATDEALVDAQLHPNAWHVRMARLVLSERAAAGPISETAIGRLKTMATQHTEASRRLRAVWALHGMGLFTSQLFDQLRYDESEYVRSSAVHLAAEFMPETSLHSATESGNATGKATINPVEADGLAKMALTEPSLLLRRSLASAIPRVPPSLGWILAENLSRDQAGKAHRLSPVEDRELPNLIWYGLVKLLPSDPARAFALAETTSIPLLCDEILWYSAKLSDAGRNELASRLVGVDPATQLRLLSLLELAVRNMRGLAAPPQWAALSKKFYESPEDRIRNLSESIGAAFGDAVLYARMRTTLTDEASGTGAQQHALAILSTDSFAENLVPFLGRLDVPELAPQIIPLLSRFNDVRVAEELMARLPQMPPQDKERALDVLSGRFNWAHRLLDRLETGEWPKSRVTAFNARQMASLGDPELTARLTEHRGAVGQTSDELRAEILKVSNEYKVAPLWAFSGENGAANFKKPCAQCHLPNAQSEAIAPRLAGSGAKGIDYLAENIVNPNAVIGRDYQARIVVTTEGRVINGLIEKETDSSLTIRTLNISETIARTDIKEIQTATSSFMPEGLLKTLNERERVELFKFLMQQ